MDTDIEKIQDYRVDQPLDVQYTLTKNKCNLKNYLELCIDLLLDEFPNIMNKIAKAVDDQDWETFELLINNMR